MQKFLIFSIFLFLNNCHIAYSQGRFSGGSGGGYAHEVYSILREIDSCNMPLVDGTIGHYNVYTIEGKQIAKMLKGNGWTIKPECRPGLYIYSRILAKRQCPAKKWVVLQ